MIDLNYYTIESHKEGFYEVKKSKFYSFAYPIYDEEDAKKFLKELKLRFPDAKHICYAYSFGKNRDKWKAYDGGEPSNSAGMPIFGQIRSFDISDVLIVVIRYFGGTKLGVGGLQEAYKMASIEALKSANRILKVETVPIDFKIPFSNLPKVMHILAINELKSFRQSYSDCCNLQIDIPVQDSAKISNEIQKYCLL